MIKISYKRKSSLIVIKMFIIVIILIGVFIGEIVLGRATVNTAVIVNGVVVAVTIRRTTICVPDRSLVAVLVTMAITRVVPIRSSAHTIMGLKGIFVSVDVIFFSVDVVIGAAIIWGNTSVSTKIPLWFVCHGDSKNHVEMHRVKIHPARRWQIHN